jgi:tetratricopeptide (TPR) repeat protein
LVDLDRDKARLIYEQSLARYQELDDQWGIAKSLEGLGTVDWVSGYFVSALERTQAAERIRRQRGDRKDQANSLQLLGLIHKHLGHLDEAERLHRKALSLSQTIGDRSPRKCTLAHTLEWQGKFEEAQQLAREGLVIAQDLGQLASEAFARRAVCAMLIHTGQYQQARQQVAGMLPLLEEMGLRPLEASLYDALGFLALSESSYVEAQSVFAKSASILRETWQHIVMIPLTGLGYAACRLGQLPEARRYFAEALTGALAFGSYIPAVFALSGVALLLATSGKAARAVDEVWALCQRHPYVANSKWFADVAGRELEALTASLPLEVAEAAKERGRSLDLWETAEALLDELG